MEVTLITCPLDAAEKIASALVNERLAACVNIIPQVSSVYRWKDKVEKGTESLLIVKSSSERGAALEARVLQMHPYSCPEIIRLTVSGGFGEYLSWVAEQTEAVKGQDQ